MAGINNYSYDRLPSIHEGPDITDSQDIADANGNPNDSQTTLQSQQPRTPPPGYAPLERRSTTDRQSILSDDTEFSTSSKTSSIEKIKYGWNRLRRKPVSGRYRGSIRQHPVAEIKPTRIGRGVWHDQQLVDRSLRTMAVLMTLFAIGMLIVVATHLKAFQNRANRFTSSIGGESQNCKTVTHTNTALLFLINVAATMILGMSNTYQQLITSLKIGDLKHMLKKFGDSRVGTNSPFNINHKSEGKRWSWAAWVLLILTSMPVHFLANSVIGPSFVLEPPSIVEFNETSWASSDRYLYYDDWELMQSPLSFTCWSAFRTGEAHFPVSTKLLERDESNLYSSMSRTTGTSYSRIVVRHSKENCTGLARQVGTSESDLYDLETDLSENEYGSVSYRIGECSLGSEVLCYLTDERQTSCRLNVRMNAAFVLLGCLVIKAIYMIAVNLLARGKLKRHLLTFGDVIVASASDPELRVQGECMVNANDSYRRIITHTCHKHCKSKEESKTGDELGHCQSCKKWNSINKLSHQQQPTIATKIKKSLISNLGNTALTQMLLLMFCSFVLLFASIFVAIVVGTRYDSEQEDCKRVNPDAYPWCNMSKIDHFSKVSGGFGGFNRSMEAASLAPDRLENEFISFCISNGAQFIYSLLYLMMIYNITLVSQERDWGKLEHVRKRLRCTIVKGESFSQDYLLQLPKKILFPIMAYSVLTHWMLGEALQTQEAIWLDDDGDRYIEHSKYIITYAAYPLWFATALILLMTGVCWWAFTYKREGFIPQMFGSIRVLCASTTSLDDFPSHGIKWGDLDVAKQYRHAGLSAEEVDKIIPNELYTGTGFDESESVSNEFIANNGDVVRRKAFDREEKDTED